MPNPLEGALRLMLVDDSVEHAETIVSALRNAGIAVRPLRPADREEMAALLASQPVDLVLADRDAGAPGLDDALALVRDGGKDLPVLAMVARIDDSVFAQTLAAGARALVLRDDPAQLLATVRSEWEDLEARRSLRRLQAQLRETERRCDALIESSRDPIAYVHEGMHIRANSAYLDIFGFESFEDVEGLSLLDLVAPQHVDAFKRLLKDLGRGEPPPPRYELQARAFDGGTFPAVLEFTSAMYEGEPCQQIVIRRQAVDPELAREVEELRQRDQVTGLFNRPTFMHALEDAVGGAAQGQQRHGLLLVEADHHLRLLQEIGLDSADALLAALAERLRGALEDDVVAARFGEHTFAVLLRNADFAATLRQADRIREAFRARLLDLGQNSSPVTASVGGVQIGEKIANLGQVLAKANAELQSALGVGGDRSEIHDPAARDRVEQERIDNWVRRLREALRDDGFLLYYQPIVSLQGEHAPMYECLLRLDGGAGEAIAPQTFLPIAEEHDLLTDIDRWVVSAAIDTLARSRREGRPVTLAAKIGSSALDDPALPDFIAQRLRAEDVPGGQLILELAEAKVFTRAGAARQFAAAMAALDCRVALEHFGAGLDSFQLLSHFTPAFIKLDRVLTDELSKSPDNQQRVRGIAERAQQAGVRSIAGFVQDAASMATLFSAGIDYVQGEFLAAAGPALDYDFD